MAVNKVNTNWHRLEKFGFKIQFAHRRKYDRSGQKLLPHGGVTAVSVYNPKNGRIYTGIAMCSDTQLYNKKWGRDVAIADAVGHLQYDLIPEIDELDFLSNLSTITELEEKGFTPLNPPVDITNQKIKEYAIGE